MSRRTPQSHSHLAWLPVVILTVSPVILFAQQPVSGTHAIESPPKSAEPKPEEAKSEESQPVEPKGPAVIEPGVTGTPEIPGRAPSDALVLFDGSGFELWRGNKEEEPVGWKLVDGAMEIVPRTGTLRTREAYGYGQYHVEFRTPAEVKGKGQGRGNSGVFLLGGPEIQVLDSYENETYFDGQCGALYGHSPPLVNASRPPGVWQTYDVILSPPRVDTEGQTVRPGAVTVLHNGVLIQNHVEIGQFNKLDRRSPISLQDHGNPVQYRNIWYRPYREPIPKRKR